MVVDDVDELVVELGACGVVVAVGVVALAAEDVEEGGAGFVEAAAFADGLEAAVELEGRVQWPLPRSRRLTVSRVSLAGVLGTVAVSTARVALKYCSATLTSEMRA